MPGALRGGKAYTGTVRPQSRGAALRNGAAAALGCKSLDKIDIKRKEFSALKSERVQKKQKILTAAPSNKDF